MSGMWVLTRRATQVIALPRIVTFLQPNLFTNALASGPAKERYHYIKPPMQCRNLQFSYKNCDIFLIIAQTGIVRGSDYSPAIALSEDKDIQGHNSV